MPIRPTRRRYAAGPTLAVALALGVAGCQPGGEAVPSSAPVATTGTTTGSGTGSAGVVFLDEDSVVARGTRLVVACNGAAPTDHTVDSITTAKTVPLGTRLVFPDGVRVTLCPGTAYTPSSPAVKLPSDPRELVRVRVFLENGGRRSQLQVLVAEQLVKAGSTTRAQQPIIFDSKGYLPGAGVVQPGETGTWELVLAVPRDGQEWVALARESIPVGFSMKGAAQPGQPSQIKLAPSAVGTPKIVPTAPAGTSLAPGGYLKAAATQLPHQCDGAAPSVTRTVELETPTRAVVAPGETLAVPGWVRLTLCPGKPFQPSSEVYPAGDFDYRQYTAFYTGDPENVPKLRLGDYLMPVLDKDLTPVPGAGRVADLGEIAYAPRVTFGRNETVVLTFAVAIPKSGGPYFLSGVWDKPIVYSLP